MTNDFPSGDELHRAAPVGRNHHRHLVVVIVRPHAKAQTRYLEIAHAMDAGRAHRGPGRKLREQKHHQQEYDDDADDEFKRGEGVQLPTRRVSFHKVQGMATRAGIVAVSRTNLFKSDALICIALPSLRPRLPPSLWMPLAQLTGLLEIGRAHV